MNKIQKKTIIDIAKASGVSVSTVSRILNGRPDVASDTRQRVLHIIEENGYAPQAQWQQIALGRSRTICLHYPIGHTSFGQIAMEYILGVTEACDEHEYFLNLATTPLNETSLLKLYRSGHIDGMILMEVHTQDWRVDLLRQNQLPFVMIGHPEQTQGLSFFDMDFEGAATLAVDYLHSLGHREICLFSIEPGQPKKTYGPAVRSVLGYNNAREKYQLPNLFREAPNDVHEVERVCQELLRTNCNTTAIITTSSTALLGVLHVVRALQLRIPEDISILALAPEPVAQFTSPSLTTIQFPSRAMGHDACTTLIEHLEGNTSEVKQVLVPTELIIHESTGAAKTF
jgi:DNA-binding LacI/PurR family transcriptional regulator